MLVGQNLRLDMAGPVEEAFEKALAATESGGRFANGGFVEIGDLFHLPCDLQAAPTTAMRRLDGDGQAVFFGKSGDFGGGRDGAVTAGDQRRADAGGDAPRFHFIAQRFNDMWVGADPAKAGIDNRLRKFGAFGQKP